MIFLGEFHLYAVLGQYSVAEAAVAVSCFDLSVAQVGLHLHGGAA